MALEGSLQDMPLTDLFQVFRMGPKSGTLLLVGGSQRGVIYVAEGRLIDAAVVRGPDRQIIATGEEAVVHLLQWHDGTFTFRADPTITQRPVRIMRDGEELVLEAMRRHDDLPLPMPHQRITLDTQLDLAPIPGSAAGGLSLDLNQWRLLSQVSISHNVADLCEKTGMPSEQVIRLATELAAIGLIDIVQPQRQARPPAPSRRHERLDGQAEGVGMRHASAPAAGRPLLGAIMRRIRSL